MDIRTFLMPQPGSERTWLLFVELTVPRATEPEPRKPVQLALGIDASTSMGGTRLACAAEAARAVLEQLGPDDLLHLFAFNSQIHPLFGPAPVDDAGRESARKAIDALRPSLGTALHDALGHAHSALRGAFLRGARPQAILMTDGMPSRGAQEPAAFESAARAAAQDGITSSAIGIGRAYDERVVGAIAAGGGGRYSHAAQPADIPGALASHLEQLFEIGVDGASVHLTTGADVKEGSLLHRYSSRTTDDGLVVEVGPFGPTAPRRLLFRLKTRTDKPPAACKLAISARGKAQDPARILSVEVAPPADQRDALQEYWRLRLARCEEAFWDATHRTDAEEALAQGQLALAELQRAGSEEQEVALASARLSDQREVLEGRLDAEHREQARKRSFEQTVTSVTGVRKLWEPKSNQ